MRAWYFLLVSLLLTPAPLPGQSPQLRMDVDTAVVTVGDRITLTVSVDHPTGSRVIWPDSLNLAPFEVLAGQALPPTPIGESTRSSLVLELAAFELGDLEIPSFDLEVVDANGETTSLTTNRFGIQILTVGLDEGEDIRDIRGPWAIPVGVVQISVLLLALILAAALAWILFRRLRRGDPEPRDTAPASRYRPPHEVALEALARIEETTLLERGQVKEYHIEVSEVLRTYIEGRFGVPALELTTSTIMSGLENASLTSSVLDGFGDFLRRCDMVKFAKHRPEFSDSQAVLSLGRRLVEETIPIPGSATEMSADRPGPSGSPEEGQQEQDEELQEVVS